MSGIETVMLIASIVSAFSGATTLYRNWRKDNRERQGRFENQQLNSLMLASGGDVQRTYDQDFRRLGQPFARGDDIGHMALMRQLIDLQQTVIELLSRNQNSRSGPVMHPYHQRIYDSSASARRGTLSALSEQYQRMLPSAPLCRNRVFDFDQELAASLEFRDQDVHLLEQAVAAERHDEYETWDTMNAGRDAFPNSQYRQQPRAESALITSSQINANAGYLDFDLDAAMLFSYGESKNRRMHMAPITVNRVGTDMYVYADIEESWL